MNLASNRRVADLNVRGTVSHAHRYQYELLRENSNDQMRTVADLMALRCIACISSGSSRA